MSRSTPARKSARSSRKADASWILALQDYESFREALSGFECQLCALHKGRTRLVVDRGNARASALLIGEGPGAEEDREGRAFVGRSGKLLDNMLRDAGLEPDEDVLIANVVKCRPPGNRAPTRNEVAACVPYLHRQIDLLRPRCVALLGATAVRHLLPSQGTKAMKLLAGRVLEDSSFPGVEFLVTFHPAFVLRNPARREETVSHLQILARMLES